MTKKPKRAYLANGAVLHTPTEQHNMIAEATEAYEKFLDALRIDWRNDPQCMDTPARVSKMYVQELLKGRYVPCPDLREFPNKDRLDQLYIVGPVSIRSMCSHHMVPFLGQAWIGMVPSPDGYLLGLSKFARLADWIFSRPQIQEEATVMLADEISSAMKPLGLAVVVKAQHLCATVRGVKDPDMKMTTSVMRDLMRENSQLRSEFLSLIK